MAKKGGITYLQTLKKGQIFSFAPCIFPLGWDLDLGLGDGPDGRDSREFFGVCVVVNFVAFLICSEHSRTRQSKHTLEK